MSVSITLPARRLLQALCLITPLLLVGCGDTSKSPEDPRIIGVPPQVAYLGVDYSYNFGAAGGDNLLNYSLVNNPSWLALEATTNKARKGIVLRGVPGLTGGGSGEDDLGEYDRIRVTTNDGSLLGDRAFSIEVRHNALEVADTTLTEGQSNEPNVEKDSGEVCDIPDMDVTREITVNHQNLILGEDDGNGYQSASGNYTTHRSLIRVNLAQPSVKPVTVRFRVSDEQDDSPEFCEGADGCEYIGSNRERAIFGEDLFLNGNAPNYQGGDFPEPPEYIEYISEGETGATGLLNFEKGQTTCFIPVWVHEDNLAEETEYFNVELERVTEGIASIDQGGAVASQRVTIQDETPTVTLEHDTLVLSEGIAQTVTATLSRSNDTGRTLHASLEAVNDEGDTVNEEIAPLPLEISFAPGDKEVTFDLTANDGEPDSEPEAGNSGALKEAVVRQLRFDRSFQFGRDGAAGTAETSSDLYINEWIKDVISSDLDTSFDIKSLVAGALGEAYVAGIDGSDVRVQSINRLGGANTSDKDVVVLDGEDRPQSSGNAIDLAFASESTGTSNAPDITRYLGLTFDVDADPVTGFASLFRSRIFTNDDGDIVRSEPADDRLWEFKNFGDNWNQQALAVDNGRSLYAAGLGNGGDPIRMTRVDTRENDSGETSANPVWSKNLEAGDESTIAGLFTGSMSGALLVGETGGQVDSDTLVGLRDFFLLGRNSEGSINERIQFGIEEDDRVKLADASGNRIWLAGESEYLYELNDFGGVDRAGTASAAPFVLTVDRSGSVQGVLHPNDLDDESGIETIQALTVAGNDAIFAGQTSDEQAYLMAVRYANPDNEDEDNAISKLWRINIDDAQSVVDMDYFNNRKIFVVFDTADGQMIRLYDRHGNRLTATGGG